MTGIELVPASPAQEGILLALACQFHAEDGHPLDEGGAAAIAMLARGHPLAKAWLLREAGRLVGYTVLTLGFSVEHGGANAFIDDLYLIPDARGRGLGRAAMVTLEEEARTSGLKALFLAVAPDNRRARALYERQGFAATPWLTMVKQL